MNEERDVWMNVRLHGCKASRGRKRRAKDKEKRKVSKSTSNNKKDGPTRTSLLYRDLRSSDSLHSCRSNPPAW